MGGRGGAGGGSAKSSSAGGMFGREKPLKVETRYIEGRGFTRGGTMIRCYKPFHLETGR